jgi:hypothetical protein
MMRSLAAVLTAVLLLTACGSAEVLLRKPADVPAGVNFSGNWVQTGNRGSGQREARELLVHVFLETGSSLKITQTDAGIFISFDRSVVEEYRFGESRTVSVGAISAARVSGWEGAAYVVETLDEDGAKLVDVYRLQNGGRRLQRSIEIWHRDKKILGLVQEFAQVSSRE